MSEFFEVQEASGLSPKAWVVVGGGYSREEVKSLFFKKGLSIISEAVTSLEDLAVRLLGIPSNRVLDSPARQEILRALLSDHRIISQFTELKSLRRQSGFYKKLDAALLQGRMAMAHPEEGVVFHERLALRQGSRNLLREELMGLSLALETWLGVEQYWDTPLLYRHAAERLDHSGWPKKLSRPEKIYFLNAHKLEGAELVFVESLSRMVEWSVVPLVSAQTVPRTNWQRWHTLDDAADSLAEEFLKRENWENISVLIPDAPAIRRALLRAFKERDIPLLEPRDPTRLQWDEWVKVALLPLDLVASRFERSRLLSWVHSVYCKLTQAERFDWVKWLNTQAFRSGVHGCRGGMELELQVFQGKKTIPEWGNLHCEFLRARNLLPSIWADFWTALWEKLEEDLERVGQGGKRWPLALVLERLSGRLQESSPPVEKEKPVRGVRLFRLQQAPLDIPAAHTLWIFGLPPRWLSEESYGDYWWGVRDRQVLSSEFSVRSSIDISQERRQILKAWLSHSEEVLLWDALYEWDGRERETLNAFFKELGAQGGVVPEVVEMGAHPRWKRSFSGATKVDAAEVRLPAQALKDGDNSFELTATLLDRYSRCPFQGLIYHRWKARDLDDPEMELWPHVRGNILHAAVRTLLKSRNESGQIQITIEEALDLAWKANPPDGLFKTLRIERAAKARLFRVLEQFLEKEIQFQAKAHTKTVSLEDVRLRWPIVLKSGERELQGVIKGEPDRIEEHPDGLFVADYKTSSSLPNGREMLENGYRLQLPFYALAVKNEFKKQVIGLQFVELNNRGARNNGIFFEEWNGKEAGKLTQLRSDSKNLFKEHPDELWSRFDDQIHEKALGYLEGHFDPLPSLADMECNFCQAADACGLKRRKGSVNETDS